MIKKYDAIIIGSGQAGTPLAKKLALAGKKTAIIEKRYIGGTCVNDGCTPTKTWVASARAAFMADGQSDKLGVKIKGFELDMPLIQQRKEDIVLKSRNGGQKGLEATPHLDLIFGEASFTGKKILMIKLNDGDIQEIEGDLIFINAGAKTAIPDIEGLKDIEYLTSTSILELEAVPESLLVIGGSYIGMEFGQMFSRFGSKVTILEHSPRALPREDLDVAEEVVNILTEEGITFYAKAQVTKLAKADGNIKAHITVEDKEHVFTYSHVLVAAGRIPQTEALSLDRAGVKCTDKGAIIVNSKLETNIKGIYALGDVNGGPAFTHIAYNDYTIVYRNLIEKANLSTRNRIVPYCMFTDPPLGRVGITEQQAKKEGLNYKAVKLPMLHVARAYETGNTKGFMKAVVDLKTKKILGAAILGEEGGEIMSVLQMAMLGGITYEQIRYMIFAHPTYSESLNNLFMSLES